MRARGQRCADMSLYVSWFAYLLSVSRAACSTLSEPAGRGSRVLPCTWPDITNTLVLRECTWRLTSWDTTCGHSVWFLLLDSSGATTWRSADVSFLKNGIVCFDTYRGQGIIQIFDWVKHYVETGILWDLVPSVVSECQQHCREYKSQVWNSFFFFFQM